MQVETNLTGAYQRFSAAGEIHAVRLTRRARGGDPVRPLRLGPSACRSRRPSRWAGPRDFPGLALGERRGSREMLTGLRLQYALGRGLFVEANGQGGATDGEGDAVPEARWLWGGRIGFGIDTPVGGLRFAYGLNSLGRGTMFVRVGSWW